MGDEELHEAFKCKEVKALVKKAFGVIDVDKSGHLDFDELVSFSQKVGGRPEAIARTKAKAFLAEHDSVDEDGNKDGKVSEAEFLIFVDGMFDEDDEQGDVVMHITKMFFPGEYMQNLLSGKK